MNRSSVIYRRFVAIVSIACALVLIARSSMAWSAGPSNPMSSVEWEKIVAAAKHEGKLVLSGAPGELWRDALVRPFEQKYPEIKIEYTGLNGRDFWPKVKKEHDIGKHLWDLRIGGPDALNDLSLMLPVRPLLMPENADDGKWLGGLDGLFIDEQNSYIPGFLAYAASPITVNRDFIPESQLSTPEQLLDPKFKGKIVLNDPRGGAGLGYLTVLLKAYGEDYIRKLLTQQNIVVTRDNRQMTEWLVRGKYPIAIGDDSTNMFKFQKAGLGLNIKDLDNGAIGLSMGFGGVMYLDRAPHPNAAKVYINWLLSAEGQKQVTQKVKLNSRRLDVPPADPGTAVNPKKMSQYVAHQEFELLAVRNRAKELASELIK